VARALILLLAAGALGGCYNPRYPSETPGAEPLPRESGNSQESSVRDPRRDGAAGSGTTVKRD
jgi:hypothetical protein